MNRNEKLLLQFVVGLAKTWHILTGHDSRGHALIDEIEIHVYMRTLSGEVRSSFLPLHLTMS